MGQKKTDEDRQKEDAQTGVGGFTHWLLYNIPAAMVTLDHGAGTVDGRNLPFSTVQLATSFGTSGWSGPCPPMGDKPYRYVFTLYALGTAKLELPANTTQAHAGFVINSNSLRILV